MNQSPSSEESYRATAFADAKPELAAPGATPERLAHLKEHGFVIITDFVDNPWIPTLREAGRRVTEACTAPETMGPGRSGASSIPLSGSPASPSSTALKIS